MQNKKRQDLLLKLIRIMVFAAAAISLVALLVLLAMGVSLLTGTSPL